MRACTHLTQPHAFKARSPRACPNSQCAQVIFNFQTLVSTCFDSSVAVFALYAMLGAFMHLLDTFTWLSKPFCTPSRASTTGPFTLSDHSRRLHCCQINCMCVASSHRQHAPACTHHQYGVSTRLRCLRAPVAHSDHLHAHLTRSQHSYALASLPCCRSYTEY